MLKHFLISVIITLIVFGIISVPNLFSQEQPFPFDNIKTALKSIRQKQTTVELVVERIKIRKVNFILSDKNKKELLSLGATEELIEAIIDNYYKKADLLPPLKIPEIDNILAKDNTPEAQNKLIEQIKTRKVEGKLDKTTEDFLKDGGATAELIGAIKANPYSADTIVELPTTATSKVVFTNQKSGMEFVLVPKGAFVMGSSLPGYPDNEKPARTVNITKDFLIGRYEVSQGEWDRVMGKAEEKIMATTGANETIRVEIIGEDYPMVGVNWFEAKEFIARLNAAGDGYIYSLPNEAEWEYACRAGTTTLYAFGDVINHSLASYNINNPPPLTWETPEKSINKLKSRKADYIPNRWGIYDMHGNAREWCEDAYTYDYKGLQADGTNLGKKETDRRVLRGGAWNTLTPTWLRSAYREYKDPYFADLATGFRVVARRK